jgi:hypothetical protein
MNKLTQSELRMQMLAGVITEGEYTAIINKETEEEEKSSLNESMIGGIVGVGAINQIPATPKTDYENAFEHFLGERYMIRPNRERDDIKDVNEEEGKEEVEEAMVPSDTPTRVKFLNSELEYVWNMGKGNNPIDFEVRAKQIVNDMFGDLEEGKEVEEPNNY